MFFKVVFGTQIHVMNSKEPITYSKLESFIRSTFKKLPAKYTLTYKDSDEDMISLLNDVDMKILLESGINKVRIQIQESSEEFYDHTQQIVIQEEPIKKVQQKVVEPEPKVTQMVEQPIEQAPSFDTSIKSIDQSINQKLAKLMPDLISKIKEEVITQSKIRQPRKVSEETKAEKVIEEPIIQQEVNNKVIHTHVTCDQCHTNPIVGIRYKCVVCPDFDLCQSCEAKTTHDHPFLKIRKLKHTPMKIFAVIDDQDEGLEINGQKIPLPGITEGINLLAGILGGHAQRNQEQCRRTFGRCREQFKNFAHQMRENCKQYKTECKKEQKVEQKVEPKVEQKVQPKVEIKVEPKVQIKVEPKVEQKVEPKVEILKPEIKKQVKVQPVVVEEKKQKFNPKSQQDTLVQTANYISEIMGQDFRKCYRFAVNYPTLTKEEILMKFLEQ